MGFTKLEAFIDTHEDEIVIRYNQYSWNLKVSP